MKRNLALGIIPAIMLLLTACSSTPNPAQNGTQETGATEQLTAYTLEEVAAHASKEDCWLSIKGKVYDVTAAIPRHPGGEAILAGCGKEATGIFENRPGDKGPHSEKAHEGLANFLIGELKQ